MDKRFGAQALGLHSYGVLPAVPAQEEVESGRSGESQSRAPGERTILIVEHNRTNLRLLRGLLKYLNCRIVEAHDGAMALQLLQTMEKPPDILLTDIVMPHIDGITLIRWLRHLPQYNRMPIIVVSAFGAEADIRAAMEAGCSGYVTKPLEIRPFVDLLAHLLRG